MNNLENKNENIICDVNKKDLHIIKYYKDHFYIAGPKEIKIYTVKDLKYQRTIKFKNVTINCIDIQPTTNNILAGCSGKRIDYYPDYFIYVIDSEDGGLIYKFNPYMYPFEINCMFDGSFCLFNTGDKMLYSPSGKLIYAVETDEQDEINNTNDVIGDIYNFLDDTENKIYTMVEYILNMELYYHYYILFVYNATNNVLIQDSKCNNIFDQIDIIDFNDNINMQFSTKYIILIGRNVLYIFDKKNYTLLSKKRIKYDILYSIKMVNDNLYMLFRQERYIKLCNYNINTLVNNTIKNYNTINKKKQQQKQQRKQQQKKKAKLQQKKQ